MRRNIHIWYSWCFPVSCWRSPQPWWTVCRHVVGPHVFRHFQAGAWGTTRADCQLHQLHCKVSELTELQITADYVLIYSLCLYHAVSFCNRMGMLTSLNECAHRRCFLEDTFRKLINYLNVKMNISRMLPDIWPHLDHHLLVAAIEALSDTYSQHAVD